MEKKKTAPEVEADIRRLKRENFVLVLLVSILFCLVIALFDRTGRIEETVELISYLRGI